MLCSSATDLSLCIKFPLSCSKDWHLKRKCVSSSTADTLQHLHNLFSFEILEYRPLSMFKLWALSLIFDIVLRSDLDLHRSSKGGLWFCLYIFLKKSNLQFWDISVFWFWIATSLILSLIECKKCLISRGLKVKKLNPRRFNIFFTFVVQELVASVAWKTFWARQLLDCTIWSRYFIAEICIFVYRGILFSSAKQPEFVALQWTHSISFMNLVCSFSYGSEFLNWVPIPQISAPYNIIGLTRESKSFSNKLHGWLSPTVFFWFWTRLSCPFPLAYY